MGSLILTELPVKPFALLMHGQGLVDEGLTRSLQDLPCLLRIVTGSHRLKNRSMMGRSTWPLAGTPEVLARFSTRSNGGRADLLTFGGSGGVSAAAAAAAAALPTSSADGTDVPAIITSADSTERALRPA
jgi:hypothetical protein